MTTSLHFYSLSPTNSVDVTTSYPLINSYAGTVGLNFDTAQCYGSYFPLQKPYSNTIYLTGTQAIFLPNTPGNLVELEFFAEDNVGFIGISSFDSIPTTWYRIYGNASSSTGSTNTSAFSGKYVNVGSWQRIEGNARLLGKWLVIKVENGYAGFRRVGIKSTEEELPFFSAPINYNGGDTVVIRTANTGEWMLGELKDGLKFSRDGKVNTTPRGLTGGNNSEVGEIGVHGDRLVYSKTHVYGDNKLPPTGSSYYFVIDSQPASASVQAPDSATFSVTAVTSVGTLSYQWKKNGVDVGTNSSTYSTGATTWTGVDDEIICVVSNGIEDLLSDTAILHVLPAISVADVGWWKLNETSGTIAADSSGNNRHATVTGPTWSDGLVSNGAGSGIAVANVGTNIRSQPISYCLWFTPGLRTRVPAGLQSPFPINVLSNDIFGLGGLGLAVNTWDNLGGGRNCTAAYFYGADLPSLIQPGVRRHYAVVGDATSSKLYIDGNLIASSASLQNFASSSGTLRFNYHNDDTNYGNQRFSMGTLRDVRLYKKVLTEADIRAIFSTGPAL